MAKLNQTAFAAACCRQLTIQRMIDMLDAEPDPIPCDTWGLTFDEYREGLLEALREKTQDLIKGRRSKPPQTNSSAFALLTDSMAAKLKAIACQSQRSIDDLFRDALEQFIQRWPTPEPAKPEQFIQRWPTPDPVHYGWYAVTSSSGSMWATVRHTCYLTKAENGVWVARDHLANALSMPAFRHAYHAAHWLDQYCRRASHEIYVERSGPEWKRVENPYSEMPVRYGSDAFNIFIVPVGRDGYRLSRSKRTKLWEHEPEERVTIHGERSPPPLFFAFDVIDLQDLVTNYAEIMGWRV